MAPLGEGVSVTEIAPEAENLHDEVAKISAKLAAARDLREGLGRLLKLPTGVSNDAIFDEIRRLKTRAAEQADAQAARRYTVVPPGDKVHGQIKALEATVREMASEHTKLVRSLRAKGVLE